MTVFLIQILVLGQWVSQSIRFETLRSAQDVIDYWETKGQPLGDCRIVEEKDGSVEESMA